MEETPLPAVTAISDSTVGVGQAIASSIDNHPTRHNIPPI